MPKYILLTFFLVLFAGTLLAQNQWKPKGTLYADKNIHIEIEYLLSPDGCTDGGGTITSKGLCYSASTSVPTVSNANYTNNGSGIGAAGSTLTGLISSTTYYVRAYAVNSAGTSYGAVTSFRTTL